MINVYLFLVGISTVFILYVYFGYPLVLLLLIKLGRTREVYKHKIRPTLTLIISCYNEEKIIEEKLKNTLALNYPVTKIEILVVSDASTDGTDEIVKKYEENNVKLVRQENRLGKTAGLNLGVSRSSGEVIVFSDANAIYERDALIKLVENFADRNVGYVVGHARYVDAENAAAKSENTYWRYETCIKRMESRIHSVVGGDGAIYAIRRELYEPLLETDINDFVNPLQIILKGYRGVFEPQAVCYEETSGSFRKEFIRKQRIVNRSFSGLLRMKSVVNPKKTGFFSFEIFSHKLLRWFSSVFVIIFVSSSLILSFYEIELFKLSTMAVTLFLWCACMGRLLSRRSKIWAIFYYPYYYVYSNIATLLGLFKSLRGEIESTWKPVRIETQEVDKGSLSILLLTGILTVASLAFLLNMVKEVTGVDLLLEKTIFVICLMCILYVYFGYPMVLWILTKLRINPVQRKDLTPEVTLLIPAYNEEEVVEQKIKNSLRLDYPPARLRIVVASDGSTDKTNDIAKGYVDERLCLIAYPARKGKIGCINETLPKLSSEIIVFSDANTMYRADAIKKLVRSFADPSVGCVSGNVIMQNGRWILGQAESAYYLYERWLQEKETDFDSIIGADGAMYAIRRNLFVAPAENTVLDDFIISMNVALRGHRVIYEKEAIGYEENGSSLRNEFLRKSRVVAGAIQSLKLRKGVPELRQRKLLFSYISHKLLRWIMPITHVLLFLVNCRLAYVYDISVYSIFFMLQIGFISLALVGLALRKKTNNPFVIFPLYYCLEHCAGLYGIFKGLFDKQSVKWEKFQRKCNVLVQMK